MQKKSKYVCLGSKDCVIDKRRRNRCQYCRFQKCLAVGMVREGTQCINWAFGKCNLLNGSYYLVVRTDSLKGRRGRLPSKSKNVEELSAVGSLSLTKALVQAFVSGTRVSDKSPDHSPVHCIGNSDQMMDSISTTLHIIQSWADKIPGWNRLTLSDRSALLLNGAVNVLSLRLAYL